MEGPAPHDAEASSGDDDAPIVRRHRSSNAAQVAADNKQRAEHDALARAVHVVQPDGAVVTGAVRMADARGLRVHLEGGGKFVATDANRDRWRWARDDIGDLLQRARDARAHHEDHIRAHAVILTSADGSIEHGVVTRTEPSGCLRVVTASGAVVIASAANQGQRWRWAHDHVRGFGKRAREKRATHAEHLNKRACGGPARLASVRVNFKEGDAVVPHEATVIDDSEYNWDPQWGGVLVAWADGGAKSWLNDEDDWEWAHEPDTSTPWRTKVETATARAAFVQRAHKVRVCRDEDGAEETGLVLRDGVDENRGLHVYFARRDRNAWIDDRTDWRWRHACDDEALNQWRSDAHDAAEAGATRHAERGPAPARQHARAPPHHRRARAASIAASVSMRGVLHARARWWRSPACRDGQNRSCRKGGGSLHARAACAAAVLAARACPALPTRCFARRGPPRGAGGRPRAREEALGSAHQHACAGHAPHRQVAPLATPRVRRRQPARR